MELTDFEATRKDKLSGDYLDLCNSCFAPISTGMVVAERWDLFTETDIRESENAGRDNEFADEQLVPYEDDAYVDDFETTKEHG